MDFQDKRYVIGIDLGTTNCAVSYVDLSRENKKDAVRLFSIPQLTGEGEFAAVDVLPSFLYIPGEYDISKEAVQHPWKKEKDRFAGVFARDHGSRIPARLVSSAKSWLCHAGADREAGILPFGSVIEDKVSPVQATAEYLKHIKKAWNHRVKDEDLFLENQFVVITVPASFDETARDLTLKGAGAAGLGGNVTLLEEPLAAFYSWLIHHEGDWPDHVKPDELILVCDVGGGTTDFTLITVKESEGSPRFERLAVGDHLMLGGDNMDLALAELVESKFQKHPRLSTDKWKTLCHQCRQAKERILQENESKVRITIKGEGRALIAGTLSADLTREEVESVLMESFFTSLDKDDSFEAVKHKQVGDFGLAYEKESSISRHIAVFLENQRENIAKMTGREPMPDHILFNGGALKPDMVRERIRAVIRDRFECSDEAYPWVLENRVPDLAVGLGASYYGLVKQGSGVKVGSGSPRSYYIGVQAGSDNGKQAVCLVERGLDEGSRIRLEHGSFEVLANQPVVFDIYSSSYRYGDKAGDIVEPGDTLTLMPPLKSIIKFGGKGEKKKIPVTLEAEYTELGTLSLWCRSNVSDHKWRLRFQLRDQKAESGDAGVEETEVLDDETVENACSAVDDVFDENVSGTLHAAGIAKAIEKTVKIKKAKWPLSFLRTLADRLIQHSEGRFASAEHEARWLNLAGFCMRPGFGDEFDEERARRLWTVYLAGLKFEKQQQNRIEWWIFIRRIAGGLKAGQQRQFFQNTRGVLLEEKGGRVKMSPQEHIELWMAAANMERLLVKDKIVLGKALLKKLVPGKTRPQLFWALSRIGARRLFYGSVDRVVGAAEVTRWINTLLKKQWKGNDPVVDTILRMAGKTDDRTRDLEPETIEKIIHWIGTNHPDEKQRVENVLKQRVEIERKEQSAIFGESLPAGLLLKSEG
ncbi:MAG: Hsp70 family protein [Desulfobacteraceae bacterium]